MTSQDPITGSEGVPGVGSMQIDPHPQGDGSGVTRLNRADVSRHAATRAASIGAKKIIRGREGGFRSRTMGYD